MSIFKPRKPIYEQTVSETECSAMENNCSEVFRAVPDRSEGVPEGELIRKWYEKQAETGIPERWRTQKVVAFVALLTVTVCTAYAARDWVAVMVCTVLFAAYAIAVDPLGLTRRKVSKPTRYLVASAFLPTFAIVANPCIRTVAVAAVIALIVAIIAYKGNTHWRAAESYKMSRHVIKALQPDKDTDNRDACAAAWQADGAREVVAVAAEMGAYGCPEIEWAVRKAAYTIGFCRANQISRRHQRELTEALREAEGLTVEVTELQSRLTEIEDYAEEYDVYQAKLQKAEKMAKEGAEAMARLIDANGEIERLKRRIEILEAANEDLVQTADNPILAGEVAQAEIDRRLQEAWEKGYSVRDTAKYAGVSTRKAHKFLTEKREEEEKNNEKEAQEEKK